MLDSSLLQLWPYETPVSMECFAIVLNDIISITLSKIFASGTKNYAIFPKFFDILFPLRLTFWHGIRTKFSAPEKPKIFIPPISL